MQLFGNENIIGMMETYDIPEDEYASGKQLIAASNKAQQQIENKNLDSRLYLYKYDAVLNYQRKFIYSLRDKLLENEENFFDFLDMTVKEIFWETVKSNDAKLIAGELFKIFHFKISREEILKILPPKEKFVKEWFDPFYIKTQNQWLEKELLPQFNKQSQKIKTNGEFLQASQNLILQLIDRSWSNHLEIIDILKQEANLFSYASEDPLIDYALESKKMFEKMLLDLKKRFLNLIFDYLKEPSSPSGRSITERTPPLKGP